MFLVYNLSSAPSKKRLGLISLNEKEKAAERTGETPEGQRARQ